MAGLGETIYSMNGYDFFIVLIQLALFWYFYHVTKMEHNDEVDRAHDLVDAYSKTIDKVVEKFIQKVADIERTHFEQLQKQSTRQLEILEKQSGDFIDALASLKQPAPEIKQLVSDPHVLDKIMETENSIEKEEIPEQNLDDINRIPLINNLNVQFEGEEEVHPIQIEEMKL